MLVNAAFAIAAQSTELLCRGNGEDGGVGDMARRRRRMSERRRVTTQRRMRFCKC